VAQPVSSEAPAGAADNEPAEHQVAEVSVLERIQGELDGVEGALQRLDDGSYGTCQACGAAIGDEQLAADPTACFCPEHQSAPAT
jgi:RNA polymerase-binding transcription factor DksA